MIISNTSDTAKAQQQDDLAQARSMLMASRFDEARLSAQAVLDAVPEDPEALYILAVAQRYLKAVDEALKTLAQLQAVDPGYGRAWQETGYCHLARQDAAAALAAFEQAVRLNGSLLPSWQQIVALKPTDPEQRKEAMDQVRRLSALPAELLSVRNMMSEGRWYKAENLCRHFLRQHPKHVEAMRLLADLAVRSDVLDDAEFVLESAVAFEPENRLARFDYMNVLYKRQKFSNSLAQAEWLLDREPDNETFQVGYANQCAAIGRFDEAIEIYDRVLIRRPRLHTLHLLRGHALKTIDQTDAAIAAYRHAYESKPDFGDAYWSLANLKTYRFAPTEIASMQRQVDLPTTSLEDEIHLCFALGKVFEDDGDYARAFASYARGNAGRKHQLRYDPDDMSARMALQKTVCTPAFFASQPEGGCNAPDPIFIVGLPRAGSTLLEQILASHSLVDGTQELGNIVTLAHRLNGRRSVQDDPLYPRRLLALSAEQRQKYGQAYLDETRIHRQGAPFFIDKMPNNFRHIGLIHSILPNAKIIDARRHPMGCCFSGFKQLFAHGQEFSYGLNDIGQYYRDYVELMDHWDNALPGRILRVQYEDVVADTERQIRRLLAFCDLPFEEACLTFHETERSVRTPSSEQVRQPIYASGVEQWRHFEPWLDPLKQALGPVLDHYPL